MLGSGKPSIAVIEALVVLLAPTQDIITRAAGFKIISGDHYTTTATHRGVTYGASPVVVVVEDAIVRLRPSIESCSWVLLSSTYWVQLPDDVTKVVANYRFSGCNHQSTRMPQLQPAMFNCSGTYPIVSPRRDEGSGKLLWTVAYDQKALNRINMTATRDSNQGSPSPQSR